MSSDTGSFGCRAAASSVEELLALEQAEGKSALFRDIDRVIAALVTRTLRGARLVSLTWNASRSASVALVGVDGAMRETIDGEYGLNQQQARGAWFVPEQVRVQTGVINFPSYLREYPRYATGIALDEGAKVATGSSADCVVIWSVLEPLFAGIFRPFELRGPQAGTLEAKDELQLWQTFDEFCRVLGVDVGRELAAIRYGSEWGKQPAEKKIDAKRRLLDGIASQVDERVSSRYRAFAIRPLLERYYAKAKSGRAKRRQVVSKPLAAVVTGFFGGDWLGLLSYLGEEAHPEEQVTTALPETRLYVGAQNRVSEVAARSGVPAEEIERMLQTYWAESGGASPVHQRVDVLRRYWQAFDELHAAQLPGMRPLWGLVEEGGFINLDDVWRSPYQTGLYRDILPADLVEQIDRLWGSVMLSKWPDRPVGEPYPHALMAETLGPGLMFWQGCALTAWFICEGPMSRTDLGGLANYHARHLEALSALGCPVDDALFEDLVSAEGRLGPPQPITDHESTVPIGGGLSVSFRTSLGERRDGFPILRDIITAHRRKWTAANFEKYVRARWEGELRTAGRHFNLLFEEKRKPPTLKQFAKHAIDATNHWFNGDVRALYGAIGQKAPPCVERTVIMPANRVGFAWGVFVALGGRPFHRQTMVENEEEGARQAAEQQRHHTLKTLAEDSLRYVQLEEALNRPPDLKEFGRPKFEYASPVLASSVEDAWARYVGAIETAKHAPVPPPQSVRSPGVVVATRVSRPDESGAPATASSPSGGESIHEPDKSKRGWFSRLFGSD